MLRIVAAIFLCFLPLHVNGLITTDAKCLSGYDWVRFACHFSILGIYYFLHFSRSAQSARVLVTLQQSLPRSVLVAVGFRPYSSVGGIRIDHANVVFNLVPLRSGNVYSGPSLTTANACRCSSVYYSLLSACAHCQGRGYLQ